MFNYFHREYNIENFASLHQLFDRIAPVLDADARFYCMPLCHADCGPRGIKPNDRSAELSERFAQYAASTPDVENPQTTEAVGLARVARKLPARRISNVRDANHIIFVQPPRDASAIPPIRSRRLIVRKLRRINCTVDCQAHGFLNPLLYPSTCISTNNANPTDGIVRIRQFVGWDRANTQIIGMGPREKSKFQPKLFAAQRALHGFFRCAKSVGRDWRQSRTAPSRIIRTIGVIT